jgi:site-specific recombinase XerD
MYEVIRDYKSYLENDCRFTHDTVSDYLGTLPNIFTDLQIHSLNDIDAKKISYAWRFGRWEPIQKGIQLSETAQSGYLLALKEFLRYLEDKGYNVEQGISEIIKVDDVPQLKLKGLNKAEQNKLRSFLLYNINNDLQRKETALVSLIWATGCRLNEALALNIGNDGLISTRRTSGRAGDFVVEGEDVYVSIRGVTSDGSKTLLPRDTVNFLNFYLENRPYKNPILFLNNARTRKPSRLSGDVATNLIERVFQKAEIQYRSGQAVNILRSTTYTLSEGNASRKPEILRFPNTDTRGADTALPAKTKRIVYDFSGSQRVA